MLELLIFRATPQSRFS